VAVVAIGDRATRAEIDVRPARHRLLVEEVVAEMAVAAVHALAAEFADEGLTEERRSGELGHRIHHRIPDSQWRVHVAARVREEVLSEAALEEESIAEQDLGISRDGKPFIGHRAGSTSIRVAPRAGPRDQAAYDQGRRQDER
jgi:hypothetical protein